MGKFIKLNKKNNQHSISIPKLNYEHPLKIIIRLFDKYSKDKWFEGLTEIELDNLDAFMEEWEEMKGVWK